MPNRLAPLRRRVRPRERGAATSGTPRQPLAPPSSPGPLAHNQSHQPLPLRRGLEPGHGHPITTPERRALFSERAHAAGARGTRGPGVRARTPELPRRLSHERGEEGRGGVRDPRGRRAEAPAAGTVPHDVRRRSTAEPGAGRPKRARGAKAPPRAKRPSQRPTGGGQSLHGEAGPRVLRAAARSRSTARDGAKRSRPRPRKGKRAPPPTQRKTGPGGGPGGSVVSSGPLGGRPPPGASSADGIRSRHRRATARGAPRPPRRSRLQGNATSAGQRDKRRAGDKRRATRQAQGKRQAQGNATSAGQRGPPATAWQRRCGPAPAHGKRSRRARPPRWGLGKSRMTPRALRSGPRRPLVGARDRLRPAAPSRSVGPLAWPCHRSRRRGPPRLVGRPLASCGARRRT